MTEGGRAPSAGQMWRHYKGGHYFVLNIGLLEATMTTAVIYAAASGLSEGVWWVRPLDEWLEMVEPGVPRFTFVC